MTSNFFFRLTMPLWLRHDERIGHARALRSWLTRRAGRDHVASYQGVVSWYEPSDRPPLAGAAVTFLRGRGCPVTDGNVSGPEHGGAR